jgi:hypothetical protein
VRTPSTLRLPFSVARRFRLEQLIAHQLDLPWSEGWRLREMFALSAPELAFARELLDRRRNLWLYRTNQRHACADFIAIDMSAPTGRRACAIELKSDEPLRTGVGGLQFAGLAGALAELAAVIDGGPVVTVQGGPDQVSRYLANLAFRSM